MKPPLAAPTIHIDGNLLTATLKASSWLDKPQLLNETLPLVISDQDLAEELSATLNPGDSSQ